MRSRRYLERFAPRILSKRKTFESVDMGLYLCVMDGEDELDGVDVGAYSDFAHFRDTVTQVIEGGTRGAKFPILMFHSDCDGGWKGPECELLESELLAITFALKGLPVMPFPAVWQQKISKQLGLQPENLYDCFIDVDGEPLLERLIGLVKSAQRHELPIVFQ